MLVSLKEKVHSTKMFNIMGKINTFLCEEVSDTSDVRVEASTHLIVILLADRAVAIAGYDMVYDQYWAIEVEERLIKVVLDS